jgi:hypothetical protein
MYNRTKGVLLAGCLPIPVLLVGGVLSLSAITEREPGLLRTVIEGFLIGSIFYPLIYVVCASVAGFLSEKEEREPLALAASVIPLVVLVLLGLLFVAWGVLE